MREFGGSCERWKMMKRTKVFLTSAEVIAIRDAGRGPFVGIVGQFPESAQEICHRLALKHGLPEISGQYGCDLRTGEILEAATNSPK